MSFALSKWYLDATTDDGSVAIAYWAEVRWGMLHQSFAAVLVAPAGSEAEPWRFTTRAGAEPALAGGALRFACDALDLDVALEPPRDAIPGETHRLLTTSDDDLIDWRPIVPRARARMRVGDRALEGTGYAERLEMTLLPWRIPADEIRWGRFIGARSSVIWIEWRGDHPIALVLRDGERLATCIVGDELITCDDGTTLTLARERVVNDDHLGGLLAPLEALRTLVAPIMSTHQTRWLSRGTLVTADGAQDDGWAIHEIVRRR